MTLSKMALSCSDGHAVGELGKVIRRLDGLSVSFLGDVRGGYDRREPALDTRRNFLELSLITN